MTGTENNSRCRLVMKLITQQCSVAVTDPAVYHLFFGDQQSQKTPDKSGFGKQ